MTFFWFFVACMAVAFVIILGFGFTLAHRALKSGRTARQLPPIIGEACAELGWTHQTGALEADGVLEGVDVSFEAPPDGHEVRRLAVSARVGLPLDLEAARELHSGDLELGHSRFDGTFKLSGHITDVLKFLPNEVRAAMLDAPLPVEISGGSIHVTPSGQTAHGLIEAAFEAVALAKLFASIEGDLGELMLARVLDPREPSKLRLLAAEWLGNHRKAPQSLLQRLLDAPDAGSRVRGLARVDPLPLELGVSIVSSGETPYWVRVEAVEVLERRLHEVPAEVRHEALGRLATVIDTVSGRLLVALVRLLLDHDHPPRLESIERRFWAVDSEAQASLLRAAGRHRADAVPFLMTVLRREFQRHGDICVDLLDKHGSVALVEELLTYGTPDAKRLIAFLQARVASGGGLALSDDVGGGGLSEAMDEGRLALEEA